MLRAISALVMIAALGACAVPKNGPSTNAVLSSGDGESTSEQPYTLVPLSSRVLQTIDAAEDAPVLRDNRFAGRSGALLVGAGDLLSLTIWEAVSGGLFTPTSITGEPGAVTAQIPPQRVRSDGHITVPFMGDIHVAGRTIRDVEKMIVSGLSEKAIEPQAVVTILDDSRNVANIIADNAAAGGLKDTQVPIVNRKQRVLDVIAAAGGVTAPFHQIKVGLLRGDIETSAHMDEIIADSSKNYPVWPGDTLTLSHAPQRFTALGAVTQQGLVEFHAGSITLAEAIGRARGLNDDLSDIRGVFVFRHEDNSALRGALRDIAGDAPGGPDAPLVFQLDLADPGSFLVASKFAMADDDVLYVSNADFVTAQKIFSLIGLAVRVPATAAAVTNSLN